MESFFKLRMWVACLIYVAVDLVCIGMGMGVPFFPILLGFAVGWYVARRMLLSAGELADRMRRILLVATATSFFTFAVMAVMWGRTVPMLLDPASDFTNFGIPMILFDPRLSFAGWLVLMILVSPFLQLLTTVFAAYLTVAGRLRKSRQA